MKGKRRAALSNRGAGVAVFLAAALLLGCRSSPSEGQNGRQERPNASPPVSVARSRGVATSDLIGRLSDPDWAIREDAATEAGRLADPRAVEGLRKLLRDEYDNVRSAAADALGEIGPNAVEAVPDLIALASEDGDPDFRQSASSADAALGRMGEGAIPALSKALESRETLGASARALATLGPKVMPTLTDALGRRGNASVGAALAAGELGPQGVPLVDDLIRAFHDGRIDPFVFRSAVRRIGPGASAALPTLVGLLRSARSPAERQDTTSTLRAFGPASVRALEEAVANEADPAMRTALAEAIRSLRNQ